MIVLDTHIWVWWVHGDRHLSATQASAIQSAEQNSIGVCSISCWEIAKLVERKRLILPCTLREWFQQATSYPAVRLLDLTPEIAIESTRLPGAFHRDPADQIIVATARIHGCPLVTADTRMQQYAHVETIG